MHIFGQKGRLSSGKGDTYKGDRFLVKAHFSKSVYFLPSEGLGTLGDRGMKLSQKLDTVD